MLFRSVRIDRGRGLEPTEVRIDSEESCRRLAQRLVASGGRRLDDASPYADVRLPDGTRCHAVLAPLAQPGTGDGGGMNVYVREMGAALARHGHDVTIYTRRDESSLRDEVQIEPGLRVRHITAGPTTSLSMSDLRDHLDQFTDAVSISLRRGPLPDVIHANYWLSGIAGHRLKHELDIPLVCTFHTLERIKAATFQAESEERAEEEQRIIGCSDAILASCDVEAHQIVEFYNANPARVHIVPLGVEHAFF